MLLYIAAGVLLLLVLTLVSFSFRTVVTTNWIHIVQSARKTTSYGKDQAAGNVYYAWPAWLPIIGIRTIQLPVSVFNISLDSYSAYDKGRLPFKIDIMAFFRITDSNVAAQRISSVDDARRQLTGILQGVARTILANSEIEQILQDRGIFGKMFTEEVDHNLIQWGMQSVKQVELMDIRDDADSKVIANIMAKKKSQIEMQSRVEVAGNQQTAQVAEIQAKQAVALRDQEAQQVVGQRSAQREQEIGIATQRAQQAVKEQEKATKTREMDVKQVQVVRDAEIAREAAVVAANQNKSVAIVQAEAAQQVAIVEAEGTKQQTILVADGNLEEGKRHAQRTQLEGEAEGRAKEAVLMAPVNAQIALASKISSDQGYQQYLITIETIKKDQAVGVAQAEALKEADIKVIANTGGDVVGGVKNAMELFTSKGGTAVGAALEALSQTPAGAALVQRFTNGEANHT